MQYLYNITLQKFGIVLQNGLHKLYIVFFAIGVSFFVPDGDLNLAYVHLFEKEHRKARLPYAAAHSERKFSAEQRFVEVELQPVHTVFGFKLG